MMIMTVFNISTSYFHKISFPCCDDESDLRVRCITQVLVTTICCKGIGGTSIIFCCRFCTELDKGVP